MYTSGEHALIQLFRHSQQKHRFLLITVITLHSVFNTKYINLQNTYENVLLTFKFIQSKLQILLSETDFTTNLESIITNNLCQQIIRHSYTQKHTDNTCIKYSNEHICLHILVLLFHGRTAINLFFLLISQLTCFNIVVCLDTIILTKVKISKRTQRIIYYEKHETKS